MWFPSTQKVQREVDPLISRMERLDARIADYESQDELGLKLGKPKDPQVTQTRAAHSEMLDTLIAARTGLQNNQVDFREIAPQLKSVSKAVGRVEWILDEADKDAARAKRIFRECFGDK